MRTVVVVHNVILPSTLGPPRVCVAAPPRPRPTHSTERVRAPRRAQLYKKCVVRDTPDAGRTELVRTQLTVD